jgi:predicted PhzF superfamily epimerase YddE/YHI9
VTGSAHCAVGPYWSKKLGKEKYMLRLFCLLILSILFSQLTSHPTNPTHRLVAYQASKRGGVLYLTINEEQGRILLGGNAVMTLKGRVIVQ